MSSIMRQRIEIRLKELGLKPNGASDKAGLDRSTLRAFLNSDDPHRTMHSSSLSKLAAVLQCDVAYLVGEQDDVRASGSRPSQQRSDLETNVAPAPNEALRQFERGPLARDVPMMGVSVGGEDHDFSFNGEISQHVERPRGLAHARKAFALYVVGTSMVPAYEENVTIFVNPTKLPAIDDYVVIELFPEGGWHDSGEFPAGKALLKRLVKRTSEYFVLRQYNPLKEFKIERKLVRRMYRVVPPDELLGFS